MAKQQVTIEITITGATNPITVSPASINQAVGEALPPLVASGGDGAPYTFSNPQNVPPGVTLNGDGTWTGTTTTAGTYNLTVDVEDTSGELVVPPIPHKDHWESQMLTLAAKWKEQAMTLVPEDFGSWGENKCWYYDGGAVYLQIADYTKDEQWIAPAEAIFDSYATHIVTAISNSYGGMEHGSFSPAYHAFSKGFMMDFKRTANQARMDSILNLTTSPGINFMSTAQGQAPWNGLSNLKPESYTPQYIRESAYCVKALVHKEMLDELRDHRLEEGVTNCVVADLENFMTPGSSSYLGAGNGGINNFMIGLALEALIAYYEMTESEGSPDTRIPPIIKTVLDFFWIHCVDPATYGVWYCSDLVNSGGALYTSSSLNLMCASAWAWYWKFSKEEKYLTQGDQLWTAGVLGVGDPQTSDYTYSGKEFSQQYAWSFDYVKWRTQ